MREFVMILGRMSFQASIIIMVVLFVRKLFELWKVSKKYTMLLWIIPFLCLVFPWKISVPIGFWSQAPVDVEQTFQGQGANQNETSQLKGEETLSESSPSDEEITSEEIISSSEGGFSFYEVAEIIWLVGVFGLGMYGLLSYGKLRKKLLCSIKETDRIFIAEDIPTPIVFGVLKPRIYLPVGLPEEYKKYVIAHEETHIKRRDSFSKMMFFIITCIHWFNPFVWYAYYLIGKDMEMTCDEETILRLGMEEKNAYANALLSLSTGEYLRKRVIFAAPICFDEGNTKGRIKNIVKYKKTMSLLAIIAVLLIVVLAGIFFTQKGDTPVGKEESSQESFEVTGESEEKKVLTLEELRNAYYEQTFDKMDFKKYEGLEYDETNSSESENYNTFLKLTDGEEEYRLQLSYKMDTDILSDIFIERMSDNASLKIYSMASMYPNDLDTWLNTKKDVSEWLTIELPEDYSLGNYMDGLGLAGGALIYPQAYEIAEEENSASEDWYHAGFVGRIPQEATGFIYVNGVPDGTYIPLWDNHTSSEMIEVIPDLDWPTVLAREQHDLYTAAQLETLTEQGIAVEETISEYWYFYFAKEGEEELYYLTLSTKCFTKEEAIEVARTVKFL